VNSINTGILLIIIGFAAVLIGSLANTSAEAGGVLLIGPIPIIFGTDKKYALIIAIIALIITLSFILL
jgi:uncharacterized protein (TIGR00304 family)